jgi:hypothetical protein
MSNPTATENMQTCPVCHGAGLFRPPYLMEAPTGSGWEGLCPICVCRECLGLGAIVDKDLTVGQYVMVSWPDGV